MVLLISGIVTPYLISRYNMLFSRSKQKLQVWFQAQSDVNRHWKNFPDMQFPNTILKSKALRVKGKDVHTFHFDPEIRTELEKSKNSIDQLIICGWDSLNYWYATYFAKRNNIPLVLWAESTANEKSWRRSLFMPVVKWVVNQADHYIVPGKRAKEYLISLGAQSSKITTFYNSVDTEFFHQRSSSAKKKNRLKRDLGIREDETVFLFVGQLIQRKGVVPLLEAFIELAADNQKAKMLFVGKGPLENELKSMVLSTLNDKVIFVSHLEFDALPSVYAAADILVLPSEEEVWGLVVNEALACGLPVIVSAQAGCAPDLVVEGKTGWIISPNKKSLKRSFTHFLQLSRAERSKLSENAVAHIRNLDIHNLKVAQNLLSRDSKR